MKKNLTSAVASKMLKSYNDRLDFLYRSEAQAMEYTEVQGIIPIIPEYDIEKVRQEIKELNTKVLQLKHAINTFNLNTMLEDLGITVDMALIRMKQLSKEKERLDSMRSMQPKEVKPNIGMRSTNQVEYLCANFDISTAEKMYEEVSEELTKLQLELDRVNNTVQFVYDDETGQTILTEFGLDM